MTAPIAVHESLATIGLSPLFALELSIGDIHKFPGTPVGRQLAGVTGGRFAGARLSGQVLSAGTDWQTVLPDGALLIDARIALETDDGAGIVMTYRGARVATPDVAARMAAGEAVDPALYYFRISADFQTYDSRYGWLNRVVAIGTGQRLSSGPIYNLFALD